MNDEPSIQNTLPEEDTLTLRYLDPQRLRFFRHGAVLRLTIENERSLLKVQVFRAFPLSEPKKYLSLRDGGSREAGMLVDPSQLDPENRRLVEEELERRYLLPVITRIVSVTERFATVEWKVETSRGPNRFTTRNLRENVVRPSPDRIILTDAEGNRYDVPKLSALDSKSQEMLLRNL